jgi:hypothetical protein
MFRVISTVAAAVLLTATPLVSDLCARNCERPAEASCPQHGPKPAPQCAHDHGVLSADLARIQSLSSFQCPSAVDHVVVAAPELDRRSIEISWTRLRHSPPLPVASQTPLRI